MSIEVFTWLLGAALGVICALIGAIYVSSQRRDDKQDARFEMLEQALNRHSAEDGAAHERIRALETEVANIKGSEIAGIKIEVRGLRERWHDLRSETTRTLASWYTSIMDEVTKRNR